MMEIGKDQHQEAFMFNFHEDDEDDEDDNRFIISLDDIEDKEDSLDECDNNYKAPEDARADPNIADIRATSPQNLTINVNAKSGNVINAESRRQEQVPETFPSIIVLNRQNTKCNEGYELTSVGSKNVCAVQNTTVLDPGNKECNENFKNKSKDKVISQSNSLDMHYEMSAGKGFKAMSSEKHRGFQKFTPHENCSCIMCYKGRGIVDTNWIPKAAKRKIDMSFSEVPSKAMKQPPENEMKEYTKVSSGVQNDCGKNIPLSSKQMYVPSTLLPGCNDSSSIESLFGGSHMSQGVSAKLSNSSLSSEPRDSSSNCFVPLPVVSVPSSKSSSSAGRPSTLLPLLVPKPSVSSASTSSLTTSTDAQLHPLASDKTHVVLINKSTVEKQLTDLNCFLQRATKVDLSKPGMALVHFKMPASISSSSLISAQTSLQTSNLQSGNKLYGLVKHHLINPSVSSVTTTTQYPLDKSIMTNASQKPIQSSLSGFPRRPNLLSKPHFPNSHIKRVRVSGGSSTLPPPPPLKPCPSSNHVDVEKDLTETIVLPLPKNDHNVKSPPQDVSVGLSKQGELLSSPSLFTFSSPFEMSPQKLVKQPLKNGLFEDSSKLNQTTHTFQNYLVPCDPLSFSSSPQSSLSQPIINMKSSSLTSSTCTIPVTTVSSTINLQSMVHFSSTPSNMPNAELETHCAVLPENQTPVASNHYQKVLSGTFSVENSNISHSPAKEDFRCQSEVGMIRTPPKSTPLMCSMPSTQSQSSVSIVSNMIGLKMKIRIKDSKADETETNEPSNGTKDLPSKHLVKSSHNTVEIKNISSDILYKEASEECCASVASAFSTNTSACFSESSMSTHIGNTSKVSGPIETAEEMFKRFEDQAMQQVYNAQFGVGEIQRNLRPNRTPFAVNDNVYSYAKVKANPGQQRSANQSGAGINRKCAVKNKRRGSGDNRQKVTNEKHEKIDINQYPKLMQDNSIVNRKTVFTPNILAGHKVYVKFNVFSNSQSGRSFLAPFFNIGGSRTQFDVEDMEYISKAVVESEREEKSCARHLLFHSREGKKAVFLRKESGLHSNELSSKSYKKHSYILEGYRRERQRQTYQVSEDWKVDNKVQIEIDRAEQDSEIDLQNCHNNGELKSSDQTKTELGANESSDASLLNTLPLSTSQNSSLSLPSHVHNSPNALTPWTQKVCESSADLQKTVCKTVPKERTFSHRDFVNILKKREGFKNIVTNDSSAQLSSVNKFSVPGSCHTGFTEQPKEVILSGNLERMTSVASFYDQKRDTLEESPKDKIRENIPASVIHIKSEVPDIGYDAALNLKGDKVIPTPETPGFTIKSEPIDDYTEYLARSMNVSLQNNHTSGIKSPILFQNNEFASKRLEVLSTNVDSLSNTTHETWPIVSSRLKESSCAAKKETYQSVVPTESVSHSCSDISIDKLSHNETEGMETTSPDPDSSLVFEAGKVASSTSSDIETSEEEESDDDEFPLTSACTSTSSVLNSTYINTPAANRKINSLVESLAQRLSQNSSALPPLFPTSSLQKKQKRKKKKKVLQNQPDSKENSLPPSPDLVRHVTSVQSFVENTSQHLSSNSPVASLKTISVTAGENNISTPVVITKPLISTSVLSSHSSSVSCPPSPSVASENPLKTVSFEVEASGKRASSFKHKVDIEQDKNEVSRPSCNGVKDVNNGDESLSFSLTNVFKGTSQLSGNGIKSNDNCSPVEDKNLTSKKLCKLDEIERKKKIEAPAVDRFSLDNMHSDNEIEIEVDAFSQHGERNLNINQDNEMKVLPAPKPGSNCSTPCSEIDVGMDEVFVERPVNCDSVHFGSLQASPPVLFKGKVCIKDFTREHDLMVPFETGPKPEPNRCTQRNVKSKQPPSAVLSSVQRNRGSESKAVKAAFKDANLSGSPTGTDLKPSVASLLCQKLAIEVEPVIPPKPKVTKTNLSRPTLLTNSKPFAIQEKPAPSPGNTSFYKPTLSAIFGVDDSTLPSSEKEKEREKKSTLVLSDGKRKQVAVNSIHRRRRSSSKTSQKLTPSRLKKECGQEERWKEGNIKTPGGHLGINKQKVGLQSFFRTWRQLSHEERKKKQMKGRGSQQLYTIPCKVVIERLEDSQIRTNGQSVKTEFDNTQILSFENTQEREQSSLNVKKRRKRTSLKVQRRRQPKEKKDIVDYYASILENLRKKAQMLEEEDLEKKEKNIEQKKSETELERVIKIEPITFQDDSNSLVFSELDGRKDPNVLSGSCIGTDNPQNISICEQIQDADSNINEDTHAEEKIAPVSLINAVSDNLDPANVSVSKTSYLETSQSANEAHNNATGKEDKILQGNTGNQLNIFSDDLDTSNINSVATRDVHKQDLKVIQGSSSELSFSSTKNFLLPFSSNANNTHAEEGKVRDEQFDKKFQAVANNNNDNEMKAGLESRQIPDSSFKTKDIVLGFENELGADTDFSTMSQGDIEDMFLTEDGGEDCSIDMIPQEEVEKLLGLDLAGDGGFDCSGTKQQKTDSLKSLSALSSGNSDGKLQWVPLLEKEGESNKSKSAVHNQEETLPHKANVSDSQNVQRDSSEHKEKCAGDGCDLENLLESQQKKHQVSPSWNRLLGSEALRNMEKSISTSSQPIAAIENNSLPSTSQLRVKFDPGALSRALKLSAEMKRVFADGPSKDGSVSDQCSANVKRDRKNSQETFSHECPKGLSETSDTDQRRAPSDVMTDHEVNSKGRCISNVQHIQNAQVGVERNMVNIDESQSLKDMAKAFVPVLKDNEGFNTETINEGSHRETRSKFRSKIGPDIFTKKIMKEGPNQIHSPIWKTDITGVFSKSDTLISPSKGLQSSSIKESPAELGVKTPDPEPSPVIAASPIHIKGIDLNKLKQKLNPLFSANSKRQPIVPIVKENSPCTQICKDEFDYNNASSTIENCQKLSLPDDRQESEQYLSKAHTGGCLQRKSATCNEFSKSKNKDSCLNPLGKQKIEAEPVLNTVKLCNILKNVTRPNSIPKSLSSSTSRKTSFQGHHSLKMRNSRKLRSSPRSIKTLNPSSSEFKHHDQSDHGMAVQSVLVKNEPHTDEKKNMKKVEEDKTERSFFDCLPGVISGVWDKS